jgi:hypothetical protein
LNFEQGIETVAGLSYLRARTLYIPVDFNCHCHRHMRSLLDYAVSLRAASAAQKAIIPFSCCVATRQPAEQFTPSTLIV